MPKDAKKAKRGKKYYKNNREKYRKWALKKHYGLTLETYEDLLKSHDYKCAVCLSPGPESIFQGSQGLCVDHCHKTGRVRGILCAKCNIALGQLEDDPDKILRLYQYLNRHIITD